ncbi:NAD(P)/FAD-dependent oxidoreductase [Amycolatopsis suaedae]|uniref:NAD(P)/FAD-dependent oxidoreductase n=1 Tax=Amycolatopsis suaedae TaxID=2510978 RepID=A0A4Q7J7G4_9PSEU|nr:FAD/NAD(P)-binding oxidoreductase [Amycolatopsis suaedae]RZQ63611.1 NAD(P)/FAD-dependent oxidoreductase [Amycolatopsis suaedae]
MTFESITVVGASLAGLRTAQELRAGGFDGRLVLVGDEPHRPYDRPPLSKDFLLGVVDEQGIELAGADELLDLGAQWYLGTRAAGLDTGAGAVLLADGTSITTDAVVVATGGRPRTLAGQENHPSVHTLRTLDDAIALRRALGVGPVGVWTDEPKARAASDGEEGRRRLGGPEPARAERGQLNTVVIGAGFIGAEVASACRTLGHSVTVVEAAPVPLAGVLGEPMAAVVAGLHADHGVRLVAGAGVAGLTAAGVDLADGTHLPADVVVVGVGMLPNVEWLASSGLDVARGVRVDAGGRTANPAVYAAGDVAVYPGCHGGHWTSAGDQARVVAANLLAGEQRYQRPGYFWSDQYGVRVQFAGSAAGHDRVEVVEGSVDDRRFVATYHRGDRLVGVLGMDSPRPFTRLRRQLVPVELPA